MPSSLSSKSHRLLTALVDSRNKKMYKVKNVITNKDPEREKEEAERVSNLIFYFLHNCLYLITYLLN
jgi:RNA polymerase-associated protein LEO1